jgi:hypothetical protein
MNELHEQYTDDAFEMTQLVVQPVISPVLKPYDPQWKEKIAIDMGYNPIAKEDAGQTALSRMDSSDRDLIELIDREVVQPLLKHIAGSS